VFVLLRLVRIANKYGGRKITAVPKTNNKKTTPSNGINGDIFVAALTGATAIGCPETGETMADFLFLEYSS
jgi:hypothetical protein